MPDRGPRRRGMNVVSGQEEAGWLHPRQTLQSDLGIQEFRRASCKSPLTSFPRKRLCRIGPAFEKIPLTAENQAQERARLSREGGKPACFSHFFAEFCCSHRLRHSRLSDAQAFRGLGDAASLRHGQEKTQRFGINQNWICHQELRFQSRIKLRNDKPSPRSVGQDPPPHLQASMACGTLVGSTREARLPRWGRGAPWQAGRPSAPARVRPWRPRKAQPGRPIPGP